VKPAVAILGGSTPFTAALVEALRGAPACDLRLFGQDPLALERMKRYGERRLSALGWTVSATRRLDEAVDDVTVVVNQIRFGGLDGRARDEALANAFQLPADETLGPCGLSGALRVVPPLRELATNLGRLCPDAWLLNLSNPLSITTRAMIEAGAPRKCVGLCELPLVTVLETCRLLRMSPADVDWDYTGLNHRGFIFSLKHRGEELLPRLPDLLEGESIFGVSGSEIRQAGAIPLKYFRLSTSRGTYAAADRAGFLRELKERLARELDQGAAPLPSLSMRDQSWYERAVVPMLAAILADDGRRIIVNRLGEDGLVRELPARVFRDRVELVAATPQARLVPWLDRWEAHERAVIAAVESPTLERIERALELDPSVPATRVREAGRAIWGTHEN
jgi:6-phospho-beta-glucosidase